jgi:hypothetical protein
MFPGVQKNVREWTLTLPSELPLWELESQCTPKPLESDYKGQNPMDWGVIYIIENLLKLKCLKWARMTHLDISNTSYGQKKGRESNGQFDSRPLKVKNRPDFLMCKWRAQNCWKALDEGYNFFLNLISIEGLYTKLWGPKVAKVLTLGIWMWASWRGTKYTIRGKVVTSPKSGPWWVLWIRVCPWLVLTPKVFKLCINQLIVWFVDVYVSSWRLSFFLVPIPELQHAPLPPKFCELENVPLIFCSFVIFTLDSHLSLERRLGARQKLF